MKNFVRKADILKINTKEAIKSGDPVVLGSIIGVATNDSDEDKNVVIATTGVFAFETDLKLAVGDDVYIKDGKLTTDNKQKLFGTVVNSATNRIEVWLR